jgi:hypothetical protein
MNGKQAQFETYYSKRMSGEMLRCAIEHEFENSLVTWVTGCYLRMQEYLNGVYYVSKTARIIELQAHLAEENWDKFFSAILMTIIKQKRDQTIQQVVGSLQKLMPHSDFWDRMKTAGEVLAVCSSEGGIYEIVKTPKHDQPMVQVNHWEAIIDLFEAEFEWITDTHANPPLKERPTRVRTNYNAGYHSIREPLVLGKFTQHGDYLSYDVINILNKYRWRIDPNIKAIGERPPTDLTSPEDFQNFQQHSTQSKRIYDELGEDPFWFVWQFDSRGRIYCHGHHVQYQSYEYKKALLSFDHFEHAT